MLIQLIWIRELLWTFAFSAISSSLYGGGPRERPFPFELAFIEFYYYRFLRDF